MQFDGSLFEKLCEAKCIRIITNLDIKLRSFEYVHIFLPFFHSIFLFFTGVNRHPHAKRFKIIQRLSSTYVE